MDDIQGEFRLLKKIVRSEGMKNAVVDTAKLEDIIKRRIPQTLEKLSPPDFPRLYFDFTYVYSKFHDFLLFHQLQGKRIVALGGGFSSGKSSFLNTLAGERILPAQIDPSTSVPTYWIYAEHTEVIGINNFEETVTLALPDVKLIAHGFGEIEDDEGNILEKGITLGHLLRSMIISTGAQPFRNMAFLDTPGYSKADSVAYSAKTDENIARAQLKASDYILWFIPADAGTISNEDIRFLQTLPAEIPKLIIINKIDKVPGDAVKEKLIQSVQDALDKKGVAYREVLTFSSRPRCAGDRQKIEGYLHEMDVPVPTENFTCRFKELFVRCRSYYDELIENEQRRLHHINQALTRMEDDDLLALTGEFKRSIQNLKSMREKLNQLQQEFFAELSRIARQAGISMPEPSEIELFSGNETNPLQVIAQHPSAVTDREEKKAVHSMFDMLVNIQQK